MLDRIFAVEAVLDVADATNAFQAVPDEHGAAAFGRVGFQGMAFDFVQGRLPEA